MEDRRIEGYIADFLKGFDDSRFPAGFLRDYEAEECLGNSPWNETLLVKNRTTGAYAVAKCYDVQLLGECSEADLLRKLRHPALPALIATYENGSMLCVVREYVAGVTLAKAAAERTFSEAEVVGVGLQLCDVLTYLHTQTPPIIHRDIKPENIVLRDDGTVALIDFGISRTFDKDAKSDTQRLGTASFAPPEQYGFAQTDCRSDIFSLGMVLGFLLTQNTALSEMQSGISDRALSRIVNKCTAFAPKERYASASELARALRAALPARRKRRKALCCILGLVLVAGLALAATLLGRGAPRASDIRDDSLPLQSSPAPTPTVPTPTAKPVSALGFTEPLIEQAVRAVLGKSETDPVSAEELASVEGLYIFANAVSAEQDGFYASAGDWYASGGGKKGDIASLADVALLPNLRVLCIAAQRITDLSPLASLPLIEKVELKHNRISDVSVLSTLPLLVSVGLNDNPATDLSPLAACQDLRFLDLCDTQGYDPAFLDALGDFEFLDLSNTTDSYKYLGSRRVRDLRLSYSGFDSLSWLSDVTGLETLEVKHSKLKSLAGIETHGALTYLNVAGCPVDDLTPVLQLSNLETLVLSEDMRALSDALGETPFVITFE